MVAATNQIYNLTFKISQQGAQGMASNLNTVNTAQTKLETSTKNANTQITGQNTKIKEVTKSTPPAVTQTGKFTNNLGTMGTKAGGAAKGIASVLNSLSGVTGIDTSQIESALLLFATLPTGMSKALKGLGGFGTTLGKQFKLVGDGASGAVPGVNGFGGAMKGLALNPIFLVIAAIAIVLIAVKTNAFGFRDALNGVGVAIGNALPQLKPFLELIKSVVSALLGITGEGALDPGTAITNFTTAITNGLTAIQTAVTNFVLDPVPMITNFFTAIGNWFTENPARIALAILGPIGLVIAVIDQYIGGSITKMITNFFAAAQTFAISTVPSWIANIFSATNLVKAINGIKTAINAAIAAFFNIFAGPTEVAKGAVKFFLNFTAGIRGAIAGGLGIIQTTFAGFWKKITDTATATGKQIPGLILNAIKSTIDTLKSAGNAIWGAIKQGIKNILPDWAEALIPGLAKGGIITGANGLIYTTNGPQLMIVGDNRTGKEDIMAVPRDNPRPIMAAANRRYGTGGGTAMMMGGGRSTINIQIPVILGGKAIAEIVKTIEIELGKNMRSIIP